MELDELKKSWNALDEHLKDKKLVKDEDISQLINHATKNINAISRLNKRLRIISLTIIALFILALLYDGVFPDIYYQIILIALIPALGWDIFSSRYLSNTKIDEQPLVTVISRFNRMHRWVIRERIIGIGFLHAKARSVCSVFVSRGRLNLEDGCAHFSKNPWACWSRYIAREFNDLYSL